MRVSKVEVVFARPVELTDAEQHRIHDVVSDAARRTETPEFVHWAAGTGCKPNWSKTDCKALGYDPTPNSPESGEPTWDDSVFYIETATRERYETEPFKAWTPRKTNAARFTELLESIDQRCAAADGPVTPTLQEATADELRRLYVFADRIRKGME
ncbi:MAG: hypothetical protein WCA44_05895 [Acidobacteriaceae bacterium]